jgi:activator of 2-hydroxyglutaryl-CoA dehydratase
MAARSSKPTAISSTCVVFAESEIVGLLASEENADDIVAGVQAAIATRIAGMAGRRAEEPVLFAGGVALVPGMADALAAALGRPVRMAADPQFTGALGAALLAAEDA